MEYRVLGPIEVMHEGRNLAIGGYRQRLVLALLVCHANTIQSTDWLVDAVWGDQAPRTARRTLQVYLVRLRRLLGADAIEGTPGGYALRAEPDAVDWVRFESLARQGESLLGSRPSEAAAILREALSLWRGSPYADLAETPALRLEVRRLQESRLAVVESRVEADLQSGAEQGLLPELDELVAEHPLREHLRGLQMLALYRAGRQVEALQAFDAARRMLADAAGIDPSAELRDLHQRMLHQDPSLAGPPVPAAQAGSAPATDRTPGAHSMPSGLVTFVFTDIEGSTRLFRHHAEVYPAMLQRHREILRDAWAAHAGAEVSTEGDGMLVAFAEAAQAMLACRDAQRALAAERWPDGTDLRVRMGAHSGLATPVNDDYIAVAVHQAARVAATANGAQVIASGDTAAAATDIGDLTLRRLGQYRLRDFDRPVVLHRLSGPGLVVGGPDVRAIRAEGHNLSAPPDAFIGRESEVEAVRSRIRPRCLVSVVGPGGVGKSRLATEVGLQSAGDWSDGVWRVRVDDLSEPGLLTPTVADVLGLGRAGGEDEAELSDLVSDRSLLLVLDGAERHIASVTRLVEAMLARTSSLGVLVTSREPLHMAGEVVVRLHPLALPQPSDPDPWSVPAVALFVDRARATSADVATDSASAADVIELVRRLDGLPLALEIAAGMLSAFTPAQVQAALEAKMGSLRTRDRTLPDRQRSLEALLTSSTATLSTAEQAVFRRLSLLAGAFTLDAATAVAADAPVAPDDVPEQVWALVDRSLLLPDSGLGGSRYRMLGLVRQFGISRLERAQETEQTWEKAAAWLLDQVGPERLWVQGALGRVQGELDNVRGVVARVDRESPSEVQETAQRLALALSFYHRGVESFRSGVSELDELVHRLPTPTPARVGLLVRLARLCLDANELVKAERFLDEAQLLQQSVGPPPWDPLGAERARGELAIRRGDPASAIRVATEAMSRDLGPLPLAQMTNLLTVAYHEASEPERALAAARDCLAATEQVGDEVMLASALSNLAEAELRLSRIGEAAHYQQRALDLAQAVGKPATMAYGLNLAARISAGTDVHTPDRLQTSVSLLVRAEVAFDEAGLHLYREDADATDALLRMARVELGEERYEQARAAGAALPLAAAIDNARDILVAASVG